jgi:hypothetical protein
MQCVLSSPATRQRQGSARCPRRSARVSQADVLLSRVLSRRPHPPQVEYDPGALARLLSRRNALAAALRGPSPAPPPPVCGGSSEAFLCDGCGAAPACALHLAAAAAASAAAEAAAAASDAAGAGSSTAVAATQAAGQLRALEGLDVPTSLRRRAAAVSPAAAAFFAHWSRLVDLEEDAARGEQADVSGLGRAVPLL